MSRLPCRALCAPAPKSQSVLGGHRRKKIFGAALPSVLSRSEKWVQSELASRLLRRAHIHLSCYRVWLAVLDFHVVSTGLCFPSYEAIADRAGVSRRSVANALAALERLGVLSWSHRLKRASGGAAPERSSNSYLFRRFGSLKDALAFVSAVLGAVSGAGFSAPVASVFSVVSRSFNACSERAFISPLPPVGPPSDPASVAPVRVGSLLRGWLSSR